MKVKVKNILKNSKKIKTFAGKEYTLKPKEEIIVGDYDDSIVSDIFTLLRRGFEVSKINEADIKKSVIRP